MSRSISFGVTYKNNRKKVIAGLYNRDNADTHTSHFNGDEERDLSRRICNWLAENDKDIKEYAWHLAASTSDSRDTWLNETVVIDRPCWPRDDWFNVYFDRVNSFKG
jgi:hypothetical protein